MAERTDARIRALVTHSDGLSRVDLAQRLGLPAATVSGAVTRLLARGELVEVADPVRRSRAGRRPALLRPAGPRPLVGVVSWNRDGVRTALATFGGEVETASEHAARGDDVLTAPLTAVRRAGGDRLRALVVSVPAPYQPGKGSPTFRRTGPPPRAGEPRPRWAAVFDSDAAAEWSDRLGVPVVFENDANLALLGESSAGAATGLSDVVALRLSGYSAGAGLLIGGRVHRGATGFAGEIAHLHVDDDGPPCACGGRGCLQTRLGTALIAQAASRGRAATFTDLLRAAAGGEVEPARLLGDLGRAVGRPLADLVTFLNPAAVVVDGSLGAAARFVVEGVRERVERYASPTAVANLHVLVGTLGPRADLFGAIELTRSRALQAATRER